MAYTRYIGGKPSLKAYGKMMVASSAALDCACTDTWRTERCSRRTTCDIRFMHIQICMQRVGHSAHVSTVSPCGNHYQKVRTERTASSSLVHEGGRIITRRASKQKDKIQLVLIILVGSQSMQRKFEYCPVESLCFELNKMQLVHQIQMQLNLHAPATTSVN